jgi:hypothetical protein
LECGDDGKGGQETDCQADLEDEMERGVPHHHYKDLFEVVVVGIDQVERGMIIVLSAPGKTIVMIDIAWRA